MNILQFMSFKEKIFKPHHKLKLVFHVGYTNIPHFKIKLVIIFNNTINSFSKNLREAGVKIYIKFATLMIKLIK